MLLVVAGTAVGDDAPDPSPALGWPGADGAAVPRTAGRENLLRGPARCVLRFLEAVRLAGPRASELHAAANRGEQPYQEAAELIAPRTRAEIARRAAKGEDHPLAPWRTAARGAILESFQLLEVRRAPRGAAVVTVREQWWHAPGDEPLAALSSEYLVGRVEGEWKVVDRRPGAPFHDEEIAAGYAGAFDPPADQARKPR